jgi:hypothetical protein
MSDAYTDQKAASENQLRKARHPTHFPSPDLGAKEEFEILANLEAETRHFPPSILKEVMTAKEPVAIKHDTGKPEFHHLPTEALVEITKALTYGARKYADYNYRAGFTWSRPFNACMRHLWAWWGGEDTDPESGISHLAHAGANVIFMLQFVLEKTGVDNRFKK